MIVSESCVPPKRKRNGPHNVRWRIKIMHNLSVTIRRGRSTIQQGGSAINRISGRIIGDESRDKLGLVGAREIRPSGAGVGAVDGDLGQAFR